SLRTGNHTWSPGQPPGTRGDEAHGLPVEGREGVPGETGLARREDCLLLWVRTDVSVLREGSENEPGRDLLRLRPYHVPEHLREGTLRQRPGDITGKEIPPGAERLPEEGRNHLLSGPAAGWEADPVSQKSGIA